MSKKAMQSSFRRIDQLFLLSKLTTFKLWFLSLMFTVSLAEIMVVSIQLLMDGNVDYDYLLTVFVFALLASSVVGAMFIMFLDKQATGQPADAAGFRDWAVNQPAVQHPVLEKGHFRELELTNKQWFTSQIEKALAINSRTHKCGALLSINLDNSGLLQEIAGITQDLLSQQIIQRLTQCVRKSDTVAQIGNAEFVLLLENLSASCEQAALQAQKIAEQVLEAFGHPLHLKNYEKFCLPSIGVAVFSDKPVASHVVLKSACLAMYQAVASGKNAICFFDTELQQFIKARTAMKDELRRGLATGQFMLYYQPQVDINQKISGAQALLCWLHPQRGLLQSSEFLKLAEDADVSPALDNWVMAGVCAQLASWAQSPRTAHLSIAIKLTAGQFKHPDFESSLFTAIATTAAYPHRLKFELSEETFIDDEVIAKVLDLKSRGIRFSLTNFGAGVASLSCLKHLPLDEVKMDGCLISGLLKTPADSAIIQAITAIASGLGLAVVADGVENHEQRDILAMQGCCYYQGEYFGKATPIHEFDERFFGSESFNFHQQESGLPTESADLNRGLANRRG